MILTTLHQNYDDGSLFTIGAEYDLDPRVTLRAGYGREISPIDDANRDTRLPETDQNMFSGGLSFMANDAMTFDVSYIYSTTSGDGPISIDATDPRFVGLPFEANSDIDISILSASVRFRLR